MICPKDSGKLTEPQCNHKLTKQMWLEAQEQLKSGWGNTGESNDSWLYDHGRTLVFQAFLDSLESRAVKRAKAQESKPVRPVFGNYATKRG